MSNLLGEVVAWDMRSTEVSLTQLQDALTKAGLDPDDAAELNARSAFGRACNRMKENRTIDKVSNEKSGIVTFQLTKKHVEGEEMIFDRECSIRLDVKTGDIECDESAEIEKQAKELFAHAMQTRNTQDVTRLVQRLFKEHADLYQLNSKGVAYFVPECHRAFTAKVDDFLKQLGGSLARFPVPKGTTEGNASVKEAVQNGLATVINELEAAADTWDEKTRRGTMDRAFEDWQKAFYKCDAYGEYLGDELEKLKQRANEVKARLAAKIQELKPEKEEASAA